MEIIPLPVGQLQANCYLVFKKGDSRCVIIDPGDDADFITNKIKDFNLYPQAILLTHGHFDHVLVSTELKLNFNIPLLLNKKDLFLIARAQKTAKFFTNAPTIPQVKPDKFLTQNQILKYAGLNLKVIETPGHTPGSVCFYQKPYFFSGDTIFKHGVGRTDFSYSCQEDLENSIKKLLKLPKNTIVLPGHGEKTTIEEARKQIFL